MNSAALKLISILLAFDFFAASHPCHAQKTDLRAEFNKDAVKSWFEVRQRAFTDFAYAINRVETETENDKVIRKIEINNKWYAQKEFIFFETVPVSDSGTKVPIPFGSRLIKVSNGKNAYMVRKSPDKGAAWNLFAEEKIDRKFEFQKEWLKPGWYQLKLQRVLTSIAVSVADDPRLSFGRTMPIEYYIQLLTDKKPKVFDKFSVSNDPNLGRIVKATFSVELETKSDRGNRKTLNQGTFQFLADWNWLPLSVVITSKTLDADEKIIRQSTRKFSADYDKASLRMAKLNGSIPVPKETKFEALRMLPKKYKHTHHQVIRPLTMKETAEIDTFRSYDHFKTK